MAAALLKKNWARASADPSIPTKRAMIHVADFMTPILSHFPRDNSNIIQGSRKEFKIEERRRNS
jgi:hypothetical protein